jgi:hypothetical protein
MAMGMRKKRPLRVVVLLALFVALPAVASLGGPVNSLEPGSWALQFRIANDVSLAAFEAGKLSLKRHLTAKSAIRAGVGLSITDSNDTATLERESDHRGVGVEITALYQRYLNPDRRGDFYWGIGPLLDVTSTEEESQEGGCLTRRSSSDLWTVGILGVAGVEWFATRAISLHAEYRASASYIWRESKIERYSESDPPTVQESESDRWSFSQGGSVLFGISVYF